MTDNGPTVVGSITAELDVNMRKWDVSVAEIKADAAEIGALNPTVKVDANVAAALSQMSLVGADAHELGALHPEVKVDANVGAALSEITAVTVAERNLTAAIEAQTRADKDRAAATARINAMRAAYSRSISTHDGSSGAASHAVAMPINQRSKAELDAAEEEYKRIINASNQARAAVYYAQAGMDEARKGSVTAIKAESAATDELRAKEQAELVTRGQASNALIDEAIQRKHAAAAEKNEADQIIWNNSALKKQIDARNGVTDSSVSDTFATDKLSSAKRSLQIAEANLDAVNKDSTSTIQRKLSAQNAVAAATRQVEKATEDDTNSTNGNVTANKQRVTGIQTLIALSPAILAAAAPIGAAAIGLGAAFGVMAGAGVLAVVGIKNAMAQGTVTGQEYGVGLGVLKGDLDQLAQTAAVRMLGSFESVVGDVNQRMPFLTQLIGNASASLGQMGGTALTGVLNGLQAMNPLINAGTAELSAFVGWLSGMPTTNGFTSFVNYAVANLPSVMTLIEGLVTTAGHLLTAFAPLGPVILGFLNSFVDIANNLPLPILAGLVTTATSLGLALRFVASNAIAPIIRDIAAALNMTAIAADLAVPVIGILLAALAGITIAGATAAASQGQATAAVTDYTQALKEDNDALGVNVRATAAKALQDAGAYDAALKLGISQKLLTDDLLGVAGAHDQVAAKMATAQAQIQAASEATSGYVGATTDTTTAQDGLVGAMATVNGALDVNNQQIQKAVAASKNISAASDQQSMALDGVANAYGVTASQYTAGAAAAAQAKAQTDAQTLSMQLQNDAAGLLNGALQLLNNGNLSLATAQTASASATNAVTASMAKNGTVITGNTDAAIANQQAIQRKVQADQQEAQAVATATGKTAAGTQAYAASKVAMENALRAQGELTPSIQAYIDKLYDVSNLKVKPTKLEVDTNQAMADARALQSYILNMRGTTITNRINSIYSENHISTGQGGSGGVTRSGGGPIYRAGGGPVGPAQYLANGGHSNGPIGTDTVAAWLTPGESVIRRSSAESIGAPALKYMNDTGKLPPNSSGAPIVHVYIDGKEMRGDMVQIAVNAVDGGFQAANNDAGRRPAR
ncbi:hypothetical protein [Arthrobacter dokdonensis]|uniref:hypothetical protein n=1 Tax=Arthrobacter dokdonellae TaxID=2211210 RepID=UPI000DE5AD1D|nr:hypothetical protein [Arthrobacter dokdonellae]